MAFASVGLGVAAEDRPAEETSCECPAPVERTADDSEGDRLVGEGDSRVAMGGDPAACTTCCPSGRPSAGSVNDRRAWTRSRGVRLGLSSGPSTDR